MKYLQDEVYLHKSVHVWIEEERTKVLKVALDIHSRRSRRLDTTTPFHHRVSPENMIYEVAKKSRRVSGTMDRDGSWDDEQLLLLVSREIVDIINYAANLGALIGVRIGEVQHGAGREAQGHGITGG